MSEQRIEQVSAYLNVAGASDALAFYCKAFGAVERYRLVDPQDGKVGHAEIQLGNAVVMLSDEFPDFGALGPHSIGGSPVKMHVVVDDVDAFFERAVGAGATVLRAVKNEFHGFRSGLLSDPFGHAWHIATQVETVTPEQMQQRWNDSAGQP